MIVHFISAESCLQYDARNNYSQIAMKYEICVLSNKTLDGVRPREMTLFGPLSLIHPPCKILLVVPRKNKNLIFTREVRDLRL